VRKVSSFIEKPKKYYGVKTCVIPLMSGPVDALGLPH
jgi:hypothetical protein